MPQYIHLKATNPLVHMSFGGLQPQSNFGELQAEGSCPSSTFQFFFCCGCFSMKSLNKTEALDVDQAGYAST